LFRARQSQKIESRKILHLQAMEGGRGHSGHIPGTLKGNRRFFTAQDDAILRELKGIAPPLTWPEIAERMPAFTPRQLRERWCNYVSPTLKTTAWTPEESAELLRLHQIFGARWGVIGAQMGRRSAPDVKNQFQWLRKHASATNLLHRRLNSRLAPPPPPVHEPQRENEAISDGDSSDGTAVLDEEPSLKNETCHFASPDEIGFLANPAGFSHSSELASPKPTQSEKETAHRATEFSIKNMLV
jgi:hypothetical protein